MAVCEAPVDVAYHFGTFRIEPATRLLVRGGKSLELRPKAFDLLVLLIANRHRVVSKEEIMSALWPDTAVEEGNLTQCVFLARKALGQQEGSDEFIATIARHGYRFVAPVVVHPSTVSPSFWTKQRMRLRHHPFSALALLGIACTGLFLGALNTFEASLGLRGGSPLTLRSLVVLPLADLSRTHGDEWLADGMTSALTDELSRLEGLTMISGTSARHYRATKKSPREIARELRVDGIVTGAVLREGDRVRLSVQLFYAPTESYFWGDVFERPVRGIFALHNEVALTIARQIRGRLTPLDEKRLADGGPVDDEAYEAYLKGRYHQAKFSLEGAQAAIAHLERALQRNPGFAAAAADLAMVYWSRASFVSQAVSREALLAARAEALTLAEEAVRLEENLAQAQATLGWFRFWDLKWAASELAFRRAIELEPSNVTAHHGLAYLSTATGDLDAAIEEMERARSLDPLSTFIAMAAHWPYYCAKRYMEAERQLEAAIALNPEWPHPLDFLANVRSRQGRHEAAIEAVQRAAGLGAEDTPRHLAIRSTVCAQAGRSEDAGKVLARLKRLQSLTYVPPMQLGRAYAGAGRHDEALTWLERAYEDRASHPELTMIRDPAWDGLRAHPRFRVVLQKMGLER